MAKSSTITEIPEVAKSVCDGMCRWGCGDDETGTKMKECLGENGKQMFVLVGC